MANFDQAAELNLVRLSDDDDLRLFNTLGPGLAQTILRLKHDDPTVTELELKGVDDLSGSASRRLGYILGQNTHVKTLKFRSCNMDVSGLCIELQNNTSIQTLNFRGINLQDDGKMSSLAAFLHSNPSLKNIILCGCRLGPASINILSNAISNRAEDTLNCLSLGYNRFSDMDLDQLVIEFLDVSGFCIGLQSNRHIQKLNFAGINLQDEEKMSSLAPFLINNPSLRHITLWDCNLGPASINILSNAILNRSEDTLEWLNLGYNNFGDIDLDQLVVALIKCRNLRMLWLTGNGIGLRGCTSLAKLLENQESSLERLDLDENSIDNDCVVTLADSLTFNTKLEELNLIRNNGITIKGWSALLKLVCNSSSVKGVIESNHTLKYVGYLSAGNEKAMDRALGVDDSNLFRACLRLNETSNKQLVVRSKIIWSHARGNLNIGESSIVTGAMPLIISWFGSGSNETNANLIQYHNQPLPKAKIDTIRLDSIFRILQSMPDILKCNQDEQVSDAKHKSCQSMEHQMDELKRYCEARKSKGETVEDITNENKELHDENKSLNAIPLDISSEENALCIQNMDQSVKIKDLLDENKSIYDEINSLKAIIRAKDKRFHAQISSIVCLAIFSMLYYFF